MTQEKFDPAALLAEWTRVHEAATREPWAVGADSTVETLETGREQVVADCDGYAHSRANARAIAHYHNTYAALLDVARGLVEERATWAAKAETVRARVVSDDDPMGHSHRNIALRNIQEQIDYCDHFLAPLSRLDAAGGGR